VRNERGGEEEWRSGESEKQGAAKARESVERK